MTEKELRFRCAYCAQETTVIVEIAEPRAKRSKGLTRAYYCEHCQQPNKLEVPDNLDKHVLILGKAKGFLRYTNEGIPLFQGEKDG